MNKTTKKLIMILMVVIILGSTVVVPTQTAQAKAVKTNGYYLTVVAKNMKYMYMDYPILKKVSFEKNKFVSYGGYLYYKKSVSTSKEKTKKEQKRTFTLSKNCKYLLGNSYFSYFEGDDMSSSTKSISKETFIKKVKKMIKKNKVNPDLVFQVKGKQIVRMYLQVG